MEKLNIAELLKDCPKGMELDCTIWDNVVFDHIDTTSNYPIYIKKMGGELEYLTEDGHFNFDCDAKCVIFPKGKTTWEGFIPPCKFKDGDVLAEDSCIFIIQKIGDNYTAAKTHCTLYNDGDFDDGSILYFDIDSTKLATEEEKSKLFQAIKDNGYKWNPESKTLEKLVESNEDVDDKIVMSGIYFDRENYADEVELHLGNYEIEVRNGKTYAVFKNQETKISKPIFKVGDKIKHKDTVLTIINVKTNSYIVEDEPYNFGILMFSQQDKWELINEPKFKVGDRIQSKNFIEERTIKICEEDGYWTTVDSWIRISDQDNWELVPNKFDITTLKPFDKVLVRCSSLERWHIDFFEAFDGKNKYPFTCLHNNKYGECIPYGDNEHLLGTTNDCDEYYKTW